MLARLIIPALVLTLLAGRLPAQEPAVYAAADAHADATPARADSSIASLAAWLARAGTGELPRARALYRWVTAHIAYDADGFRTGQYGDLTPDGVLRRRAAVCEGYAQLTRALGTAMGLEIVSVSGWSKGYGYRAGQIAGEGTPNHAWNAVRIDGRWHLMDPTWGAGFLDARLQFVRRFQNHYFLPAPESFVVDHLPQDPRWQLLDRPVSAAEYTDLAYLRPAFFANGLQLQSHRSARIEAAESLLVTLAVSQPVELIAELLDPEANHVLEGQWTFVQSNDRRAELRASFPRAGEYLLRLFARPRGDSTPAQWALDYRITASGRGAGRPFPTVFQSFGATGAWLEGPLDGMLPAGRPARFRLRAPGALAVAIVQGSTWTHLVRGDGEEFSVELAPTGGALTVFARYDAARQFTGLLGYRGR